MRSAKRVRSRSVRERSIRVKGPLEWMGQSARGGALHGVCPGDATPADDGEAGSGEEPTPRGTEKIKGAVHRVQGLRVFGLDLESKSMGPVKVRRAVCLLREWALRPPLLLFPLPSPYCTLSLRGDYGSSVQPARRRAPR